MTVSLAEIMDRCETGAHRNVRFTIEQMKEIRYAALLHDFGKVGVREEVLVKSKKLYPAQFEALQSRFDYVRKELEARCAREKYEVLLRFSRKEALRRIPAIDKEYGGSIAELEEAFAAVVQANEPSVVPAGRFDRLVEISRRTYRDPRGAERALLTPAEVAFLSIPRGSLDPGEREQIETHVVHTFNFLMQIPWTRGIRNVPAIARAHHEKMDGSGYPHRLKGDEIPVQARMMTICDIFDALSASDRPYKKAVPPERALAILEDSVVKNEIDADIFQLFVQGRVYESAALRA
jgi:response regulator RpfG family c-di-GMP phosphodiesterase